MRIESNYIRAKALIDSILNLLYLQLKQEGVSE